MRSRPVVVGNPSVDRSIQRIFLKVLSLVNCIFAPCPGGYPAVISDYIKVKVNGTDQDVPADTNVAQLLARLKIPPERITVEINLDVIRREAYDHTHLKDGDLIEIISFFGGGADVG